MKKRQLFEKVSAETHGAIEVTSVTGAKVFFLPVEEEEKTPMPFSRGASLILENITEFIKETFSQVGGGGAPMEFIVLKNGQTILFFSNQIGIYRTKADAMDCVNPLCLTDLKDYEKIRQAKTKYLAQVKEALDKFKDAGKELNAIWYGDNEVDIDLNDVIGDEYPIEQSFDEFVLETNNWVKNSKKSIDKYLSEKL